MLRNRFIPKAILDFALIACLACPVQAQLRLIDNDEGWQERTAIHPPPLSKQALIPVESPSASEMRFGIDPESIAIVDDQVVRYTIVMQGPSARTVVYEGIRCSTAEKRVYARQYGDSGEWTLTKEDWQPLSKNASGTYARELMRNGICLGSSTNNSVRDIARDLRTNQGSGQLYR